MKRLIAFAVVFSLAFAVYWFQFRTETHDVETAQSDGIVAWNAPDRSTKMDEEFVQFVSDHIDDRFAEPARFDEPAPLPAEAPVRGNFLAAQNQSPNRFRRGQPAAIGATTFEPPTFNGASSYPTSSSAQRFGEMETINLAAGMGYVIRVFPQVEGPNREIAAMQKVLSGKPMQILGDIDQHKLAPMKIYAENAKLNCEEGKFELECTGNISISAASSIIQGEGLEYAAGKFTIQSPVVFTPDSKLESADTSFEFDVGGMWLTKLKQADEEGVDDSSESADPPSSVPAEEFPSGPSSRIQDAVPEPSELGSGASS